ncbi:hypothetical protein DFJ73DRAFT_869164 [Zopfochytrium polystomum]|nr:hypothetical protein DFJ73DRAFT_869164 [Zopfochytrium polystomum]
MDITPLIFPSAPQELQQQHDEQGPPKKDLPQEDLPPGDALKDVAARVEVLRGTELPCCTIREVHYVRVLNAVLGSKPDWWRKLDEPAPSTTGAGPNTPQHTVADRWRAEAETALLDMARAFEIAFRYYLQEDLDSGASFAEMAAKVVWNGVLCDGCGSEEFAGSRFVCADCPPTYDLCKQCFEDDGRAGHNRKHSFEKRTRPLEFDDTKDEIRESAKLGASLLIEELRLIAASKMLIYKGVRFGHEVVAWPTAWHGVFVSDTAVADGLRRKLVDLTVPLAQASRAAGHWHPGSDGFVLDLVHPSHYPLSFGETRYSRTPGALLGDRLFAKPAAPTKVAPFMFLQLPWKMEADVSAKFQWLPSEFRIAEDGTVAIESYVNNLDDVKHPELLQAIAETFECILPMIECCVGSIDKLPATDERRISASYSIYDFTESSEHDVDSDVMQKYRFLGRRYGYASEAILAAHGNDPDLIDAISNSSDRVFMSDIKKHHSLYCKVSQPQFPEKLDHSPILVTPRDLKNTALQVIVKMAEIHLTPDKPRYAGGKWHLEGMHNEAIAATAIVYYDMDNISDSHLTFRHIYKEPQFDYPQDVHYGLEKVYGFYSEAGQRLRVSGSVRALPGRTVVFPNFHQHRVEPFELADASRPGRRCVLAFFVVDPAVRVASTRDVPKQQPDLVEREMAAVLGRRAPIEVVREIVKAAGGTMDAARAAEVALLVTDERKNVPGGGFASVFGITLCEH